MAPGMAPVRHPCDGLRGQRGDDNVCGLRGERLLASAARARQGGSDQEYAAGAVRSRARLLRQAGAPPTPPLIGPS
eukprot:3796953-Pyramimonas_sp.AAC.1